MQLRQGIRSVLGVAVSVVVVLAPFGYARACAARSAMRVNITAPAPAQGATRPDTQPAIVERPSPDSTIIVHGDTLMWIAGPVRVAAGAETTVVRLARPPFVTTVLVESDSVYALQQGKRVPVDPVRAAALRHLLLVTRRDAALWRRAP